MIINTVLFGSGLAGEVKIPVNIPRQNGTLTYNGSSQSPVWLNYDKNILDINGSTSGTDADVYFATFTIKDNDKYVWEDGTSESKYIKWVISKAIVTQIPTNKTVYYTGNYIQVHEGFNYNTNELVVSGTSYINAGEYTATFTPRENFRWSDGSFSGKNYKWTISRAIISTVPSQSGTLTYTGYSQTPTWNNYNSNQLTLNVSSQINAGTYYATFTPTSNYQWSGGSISAKSVSWKINKASQIISVNTQYITLTDSHTSETIYVSGLKGIIGIGSVGSTIYDCVAINTSNQSAIVVTAKKNTNGTDSFFIEANDTINYNVSNLVTIYVTVSLNGGETGGGDVGSSLNNTSWAKISELSSSGNFANYFSVGDTKEIVLNGKIGSFLTLQNFKVNAFVIGINHNSALEGDNLVHFQVGKIDDKIIGFSDSKYQEEYMGESITPAFEMQYYASNGGGWSLSPMRTDILGNGESYWTDRNFKTAMPSELQEILKTASKYTDNTGGGLGDINVSISSTDDTISLLSEYEVFSYESEYANAYEAQYQAQYEYYYSGNPKQCAKYNNTSIYISTWLRSPRMNDTRSFCMMGSGPYGAYPSKFSANTSLGISPIFFV